MERAEKPLDESLAFPCGIAGPAQYAVVRLEQQQDVVLVNVLAEVAVTLAASSNCRRALPASAWEWLTGLSGGKS
ncbi:hypothetical protein ACQP2T_57955 [Nonomuraea sp. CA-143628]|uniref:hypothetical protein n=1 Tax=Nonomuraea sp. CA-143628 TaxID=3239997 RepID=UPI003D8A5797